MIKALISGNIWIKVNKLTKIWKDQKILINVFAYFLRSITKVLFLEGTLGITLIFDFEFSNIS